MLKKFKEGWYVLYVRSRQEKKVHKLLIENQLESYLPTIKILKQWSDRKKIVEVPLFRSYIFINVNSPSEFHKALSIEGTCAYIRFGSEYARLKNDEISRIKLLTSAEDMEDVKISNESFEIGEVRKITYGSLSGLECEIYKTTKGSKIIVRIKSIQQNITATLPKSYLSEKSLFL